MSDNDNIRTLAETAYEAENYEQAYDYYSRLLESNPEDKHLWIGKGLSAGWMSTPQENRLEEVQVCLKQARENGLKDRKELKRISDEILDLAESFLKKTYQAFDEQISEQEKKSLPAGTWEATRQVKLLSEKRKYGNLYAADWVKGISTMELGSDLHPSAEKYKRTISQIDHLLKHSGENANYFDNQKESGDRHPKIVQQRERLIEKAKELDPGFSPQPIQTSSDCFVATATMGSPDHPHVLALRHFRDTKLKKSNLGRAFVQLYYFAGPPVADVIAESELLRRLSYHLIVAPLARLVERQQ